MPSVPKAVSSEPGLPTQVMVTLVTFAPAIVPEPLATAQVCPTGWVLTVTLYAEPSVRAMEKVKAPSTVRVVSFAELFCMTSVPSSPLTVPPTV